MTIRVAAKRLSRVEVSADVSNQHEFHANSLRKLLDLPSRKSTAKLDITYMLDPSGEAEGEESSYTISNVRLGKPRPAEYHMYYKSKQFQSLAKKGDILVLLRPGRGLNLRALIVRESTALGRMVTGLLADDGVEISARFRSLSAQVRGTKAAAFFELAADPEPLADGVGILGLADARFVESALATGSMPDTKSMAREAGAMVERLRRRDLGPDALLEYRLEAETALFQHIEGQIGNRDLTEMAGAGQIEFGRVAAMVLKRLQARKSRRGQSLQNHFAAILERHDIPFKEQCITERKEKPDFLIPGCAEYRDKGFPEERLRMVACKSLLRDRWKGVLPEAKRIQEKYLLTLDDRLSDSVIGKMSGDHVRLFIPDGISQPAYRKHANRKLVFSVANLVDRLRSATSA
jgi:hypothetical protein